VPFAGNFDYARYIIAGSEELSKLATGLDMVELRPILTSMSGVWDLALKDVFTRSVNEPWAQEILLRLQMEEKEKVNTDYWRTNKIPFSWFPNPSKLICNLNRKDTDRQCGLHFYNYFQKPLATYQLPTGEKKSFFPSKEELVSLFEKFGLRTDAERNFVLELAKDKEKKVFDEAKQKEIWGDIKLIPKSRVKSLLEIIYKNSLQDLPNPGVPVTLIYGSSILTPSTMTLKESLLPRSITNLDQSVPDDKIEINRGELFRNKN
jgi:hypothetical protein